LVPIASEGRDRVDRAIPVDEEIEIDESTEPHVAVGGHRENWALIRQAPDAVGTEHPEQAYELSSRLEVRESDLADRLPQSQVQAIGEPDPATIERVEHERVDTMTSDEVDERSWVDGSLDTSLEFIGPAVPRA
jgi:hypothetical protein